MQPTHLPWAAAGLCATAVLTLHAAAQSINFNTLPPCSQGCVATELGQSVFLGCSSSSDTICLCGKMQFVSGIEKCAAGACSTADSQAVQASLRSLCNLGPPSSPTSAPSASGPVNQTATASGTAGTNQTNTPSQSSTSKPSNGARIGIGIGAAGSLAGLVTLDVLLWLV